MKLLIIRIEAPGRVPWGMYTHTYGGIRAFELGVFVRLMAGEGSNVTIQHQGREPFADRRLA